MLYRAYKGWVGQPEVAKAISEGGAGCDPPGRPLFLQIILLGLLCASTAGCATCQRHPALCAFGSVVVAGSVAAIAEQHHHGALLNCHETFQCETK